MATLPKRLTVAEVASLVNQLERQPCSPRQVRYLLVTGRLGNDCEGRTQGQTRLYTPIDIALVRLAVRLVEQGVSKTVARVVLTYLRLDIIRAWKAGAPMAVAVRGVQGSLEPTPKGRPAWAVAWVGLRDIWNGLDKRVQHVCDTRSTVWMWREVDVNAVKTR